MSVEKKYIYLLKLILPSSLFKIRKLKPVGSVDDSCIRIVSYNLRYTKGNTLQWINRKDTIAAQILKYHPDSIGVQEANTLWMSPEVGLPKMLSSYTYAGIGRDDGKYAGEFNAIFYLKDKYELLDSGTFWLSKTPDIPSRGWDASMKRICTWVKLKNKKTGFEYMHFNTHLDHLGFISRRKSVNLLLKRLEQFDVPLVLTGDFNFKENSKSYTRIISSDFLKDSKVLSQNVVSHGTVNWFLPLDISNFKPIDFCFVNKPLWSVLNYQIDNSYWIDGHQVSDHYPVIIDIKI